MSKQNKGALFRLLKVVYYFFFSLSVIIFITGTFDYLTSTSYYNDAFFSILGISLLFLTELINLAIYYIIYGNLKTLDYSLSEFIFSKIKEKIFKPRNSKVISKKNLIKQK